MNNIYTTLACCGSLIMIDEEELTVRFIHHNIRQFFVRDISGHVPEYQFTVEEADRQMGRIIVTYLNYGVVNTQLSRAAPRILSRAPSKILDSVLHRSSTVKHLALGLLRSQKPFNYDIQAMLNSAAERLSPESGMDFHFLSYCREYLLHHSTHVPEEPEKVALMA
ncbi:hypothetical protein VTN77DRAFT_1660 [Rasamsonia byssochlamydoides]|uniref:uncharacterized protein n=1 Tax=Rasamsonia byssochlamydoides TaxID=89139 RepID=UPI00374350D1